jgi:hypothetical protein
MAQVQARSGAKPAYLKEVVNLNSHENWRRELLGRIARQNFCRTVILRQTSMAIIGELVNTQAVQAMYAYVVPQLEKLASSWYQIYRYQGGDVPARTWKNNFFLGAVVTIGERLVDEQRAFEAASNACRSLIVVKDRDLREAVQGFYPQLRTAHFRYTLAPDSYARGVQAGQQVRFRDEIRESRARRV